MIKRRCHDEFIALYKKDVATSQVRKKLTLGFDHHLVSFFFFEQFSPVMVSNYEKGKNIIASVG